MISPRYYQVKAIDTITQRFHAGVTRPLLSLATGLGKTICFGLLAKKLNNRTLILAHRDELLLQAGEKISMVWPGANIGIVKGLRNELDAQVVIASIQSACRPNRLNQLKAQAFSLCVIDEAHHAVAHSYKTVIRELGFMDNDPKRLLLGVTATPRRADGTGLDEVFQEIAFQMGIKEGIDQGYLSPLLGRQIFSKVDLKGVGMSHGDFIASELSQVINTPSRNALIVDTWLKQASDRQRTVGFCVDVRHSEALSAAFQERGISAAAVYGSLGEEDRRQILKDFSDGKYRILLNCMLLVEGFDCPLVDCLLMARPTQSEPLFIQMAGRATRLHPSKQNALILDFVDNSAKHRLCSICTSLEGAIKDVTEYEEKTEIEEREPEEKPADAKVEYGGEREINFFDSREFAWNKIGDHWHLSISPDQEVWVKKVAGGDHFSVIGIAKDESIQLSKQPLSLEYACGGGEDWARKQEKAVWARKDASWRTEPATIKQLDTLTKCGFNFDTTITRGEAHRLLEAKFKEPATTKQVGWLRGHGVIFPREITKSQARKLIAEQMAKTNGK